MFAVLQRFRWLAHCQAGVGLIGSAMGGGAALSATYQAALEGSVARHFRGNHAINCMCHSTENLYRWASERSREQENGCGIPLCCK